MFASLKEKYFLSDKAVAGVKRGIFWTTVTNIVIMGSMGFLYYAMAGFVAHLTQGADLPDAVRPQPRRSTSCSYSVSNGSSAFGSSR